MTTSLYQKSIRPKSPLTSGQMLYHSSAVPPDLVCLLLSHPPHSKCNNISSLITLAYVLDTKLPRFPLPSRVHLQNGIAIPFQLMGLSVSTYLVLSLCLWFLLGYTSYLHMSTLFFNIISENIFINAA